MAKLLTAIALFLLIAINGILADIDDNEVQYDTHSISILNKRTLYNITSKCLNGITSSCNDSTASFRVFQGVKVYRNDRQCAMLGGLCVHRHDCLETSSKQGLCPSNRHLGVECCYELPVRPAPCQQHLGDCKDRCPRQLVRPGTDCKNGQFCCVLI